MAIRFAAPQHRLKALYSPGRHGGPATGMAANDNGAGPVNDGALTEALRFFANHGLAAARHAHGLAEQAFFAGDRESYRRWLAICRTLDRRVARELASNMGEMAQDG